MVRGPFGSALKKDFFVDRSDDTYKVYEQGNAIRKTVDYGKYHIDENKFNELKRFEVKPNDFIMSCSGTIGELYQLPIGAEKGLINQALLKMTVDNSIVDYEFFEYSFKYNISLLETKGSGIKNVASVKILKEIVFEIPSLEEQREIVDILNKTSNIIKGRSEQLVELDTLIKSRFDEMFGDPVLNPKKWEQTTLKEVAIGKLSYGSGASATDFDGETRYVRITDITESGELTSDCKSPDKYEEKYILNDGDILFARSGATVGKTFRYDERKHGKCLYAGYLIKLVPDNNRVMPDYIFQYTKTRYYTSFVEKAQRAVAQPNINAKEYGDLVICVPPVKLQREFMAFVQLVDKLKFKVQKSLDETQILFDSLMQEYFE